MPLARRATALLAALSLASTLVALPPSVVAQSTGTVLFADSFDDPAGGQLPKASPLPDKYTRGYVGGEYQLKKLDPTWDRLPSAAVPGTYSDAALAIDARLVGDIARANIVLACRDTSTSTTSSQYRLTVRTDTQQFQLARWDAGKEAVLVRFRASETIRLRTLTNRLELSCIGNRIAAVINGFEVASVQDDTYKSGGMWFGAGSFAGTNLATEARFGRLVVYRPYVNAHGLSLETSPLASLATLRDLGDIAIASGDMAALEGVAFGLNRVYDRLASESPAIGVTTYHRTLTSWAGTLSLGAEQALATVVKQQGDAAVTTGDADGLQRVATVTQNQRDRLAGLVPTGNLAGAHQQLTQFATGAADAARQALVAQLSQSPDAPSIWGTYPVLPAPSDIPIDAGLLPVPQEFQVVSPTTGQAVFGQPPSGLLWDVAKGTGPACDGPGQRPKFVMVSGQRGATSVYPAGCFMAPDDGSGLPPQLNEPAPGDVVRNVNDALENAGPQTALPGGTANAGTIEVPCVLRTLKCIGSGGGQPTPPGQPPAPGPQACDALAKTTSAELNGWLEDLRAQRTRLQAQRDQLAKTPPADGDTSGPKVLDPNKLPSVPEIKRTNEQDPGELEKRIGLLNGLIQRLESQQQPAPAALCPPAGPTPTRTPTRTPSPTATRTPTPSPTPTLAPTDSAALVRKTDDLTVNAGQPFTLQWTVRNAGNTTWRRDAGYVGRYTRDYVDEVAIPPQDFLPGSAIDFTLNESEDLPGTYLFGLQMVHNGQPFGSEFVIRVDVAGAIVSPTPTTGRGSGTVYASGTWQNSGDPPGTLLLQYNAAGGPVTGTWSVSDGSGTLDGTFSGGQGGSVRGRFSGTAEGYPVSGTWGGTLSADGTGAGTFSGTITGPRGVVYTVGGSWRVR